MQVRRVLGSSVSRRATAKRVCRCQRDTLYFAAPSRSRHAGLQTMAFIDLDRYKLPWLSSEETKW